VTNLENGRSIVVAVNDRGPDTKGRVIDLSKAAARRLGIIADGLAKVRLEATPRPLVMAAR
jgi:rare lipoprotein A